MWGEGGRRGGSAERNQTVEGAGRAQPAPVCLPPAHSKEQAGHRNAGTGVRGQCVLQPVVHPPLPRDPQTLHHLIAPRAPTGCQPEAPSSPAREVLPAPCFVEMSRLGVGGGEWGFGGNPQPPQQGLGSPFSCRKGLPPSPVSCMLRHLFLLNEPLSRQRSVRKGGTMIPRHRLAGAVHSFPCAQSLGAHTTA